MEEICFSSSNYYIKIKKEVGCYYFFVYIIDDYPFVKKCMGNIIDIYHGISINDETYFTKIIFDKYDDMFKFNNWTREDYFYFVNWLKFCNLDRQQKWKYIELGNMDNSLYYFKILKTKEKIYIYKHINEFNPEIRVFKYNNILFNEIYKNHLDYYTVYFHSKNDINFQYNEFSEEDGNKLIEFLSN